MSNGGSLPYNLRQNKSVDRELFIELLTRVNGKKCNISDYQYIGFGGPFMEDFKIIHQKTKIKKMISVENDQNVRKRQVFNKPVSCIDFSVGSEDSTSFLENYSFEEPSVVWLDFTNFEQYSQLSDFYNLLKKVPHNSIVKITLNANPANIHVESSGLCDDLPLHLALQKARYEKISEDLGEFFSSSNITPEEVTYKKYPLVLLKCLNRIRSRVTMEEEDTLVLPLSAFVYSDGQQMVTATAIVVNKHEAHDIQSHPRIEGWNFYNNNWLDFINISLPVISQKERLQIESMLPDSPPEEIINSFDFYLSKTAPDAEHEIRNFVSYYRIFPWFGKFSL